MDYLILLNFDDVGCINEYLLKTKFKILINSSFYGVFQENERLQARSLNECTLSFNFIITISKPYFIEQLWYFLKTIPTYDYDFFRQFDDFNHDIVGKSCIKKKNFFTKTLVLPKFTVLYNGKYITV